MMLLLLTVFTISGLGGNGVNAECLGGDSCCTPSYPCGEGEGDCDSNSDCTGDLQCGSNNCYDSGFDSTDDCCFNPVPGSSSDFKFCLANNCPACLASCTDSTDGSSPVSSCQGGDSCCTASNPCGFGEGDCDANSDCADGLLCGEDNCNGE